jgi:hypothetical protein
MEIGGYFDTLCDSVALIYHEGRNVRHLVRANLLEKERWRFLGSLPANRDEAWSQIALLRNKAKLAHSVDGALRIFENRFHASLTDLEEVFGNKNWRHARTYGGNAWKAIVILTLELANALRNANLEAAQNLVTQLKSTRHNTGFFYDKLARLDITRAEKENTP